MSRERPIQVKVYLNEKEHKRLQNKIEKSKLKQSDYIRKSILNKDILVVEDIKELLIELKRIGNNINQLTKAVNSGNVKDISGSITLKNEKYDLVFDELLRVLKKVWKWQL